MAGQCSRLVLAACVVDVPVIYFQGPHPLALARPCLRADRSFGGPDRSTKCL